MSRGAARGEWDPAVDSSPYLMAPRVTVNDNRDYPVLHPSGKAIPQNVWNLHEDTDTRAIDNFIVRLRRYIEKEPSKPRDLLTVRGLGYQFVPNPKTP